MLPVISKLPTKRHLLKFLAKHHSVEPFKLSNSSDCWLSSIILQKLAKVALPDIKESPGLDVYLDIEVPSAVINSKKFTITDNTVLHFNRNLEALFSQNLEDFTTMQRTFKGDIFNYVPQFMEYYGITEDDLKFETLIKRYYRARLPEPPKVKKEDTVGIQPELFG